MLVPVGKDLALAIFSASLSVDIAEKREAKKKDKNKNKTGGFFMNKTTIFAVLAAIALILLGEKAKARQLA